MNKNLGTQTITTWNFVDNDVAGYVWTESDYPSAEYVGFYADAHRENATDSEYLAEYGQAETFEYDVPGLHVVALLVDGALMTVFEVADDMIVKLTKAVRKQQPVTIGYTKQYDGESTVRTVEPTSLKITKTGNTVMGGRDRRSGEYRSFRVDMIADYTVHRSAFVVDDARAGLIAQARAAKKTEQESAKVDAIAEGPVRVESVRKGWTGQTVPGTLAASASGWSVIVSFDADHAHLTPTGSTRADVRELRIGAMRPENTVTAVHQVHHRPAECDTAQRVVWQTLARQN